MEEKNEIRQRSNPPSLLEREEHQISFEEKKYDDHWDSCCMRIDRRATRYFTQLGIALMIMIFCIVQLVRNDSCPGQQLYSGLLTTIIGIMLPSPSLN